jgi:VWFA-related protein
MTKVSGRLKLPALSAVLFFLIIFTRRIGDSSDLTFRKSVSEVNLVFFVTDGQNRNLTDLQRTDFAVIDDGFVVREFRSFRRSDAPDLTIAVIVDASESVRQGFKTEVASALRFLSEVPRLRESELSIFFLSGMQPRLLCNGDCLHEAVPIQVEAARAEGATPLFDGIVAAAKVVGHSEDVSDWPIIVVFSDGNDTISRNSPMDAVAAAMGREARIYTVDLSPSKRTAGGTTTLQAIADATGGRYFRISEGASAMATALREDSQTAYTVSYRMPVRTPGFHSISVQPTHNQALRFRCRQGYFVQDAIAQ